MSCSPTLTDAEKAALRIRIAKLWAQYDAIVGGTSVEEFVDQNGEKVRYGKGNVTGLLALIRSLEAQLNPMLHRRCRPRPMGFLFR